MESLKPLRRALVKIGKRDAKDKDRMGYYRFLYEEICVVRAWYQRLSNVEREIEETIEEETLHHVLYNRIGLEASTKLHHVLKWNRRIEFHPIELEEVLRVFD